MRKYQMIICEQAQVLAARRELVERALTCPAGHEIPRYVAPPLTSQVFPPVREPSLYGRGTRGETNCHKAGGMTKYESAVERDFMTLMEWDYTVDSFSVQPIRIDYRRPSGRKSHYTPDCIAFSSPLFREHGPKYRPTVMEFKTKEELQRDWPKLKPKFRAAQRFFKAAGFRFRLMTEDLIDPVFLTNASFLLGFRGPRFYVRNTTEANLIDALCKAAVAAEEFTPRYLLDKVQGLAPREQIIPWMWHFYAEYVIQCDMLKPLTLDTLSWRCGWYDGHRLPHGFWDRRADWRQPENDWRR